MNIKRTRSFGLCLAAVLTLSACAATSAAAELPEFKVCSKATKVGKAYTGRYDNETCSVIDAESEGKYELRSWEAAKKKTFRSKGEPAIFDSYIQGFGIVGTVTCKYSRGSGQLIGPKEVTTTLTFSKCRSGGEYCTSEGQKAGTIETAPLTETFLLTRFGEANTLVDAIKPHEGDPFFTMSCGAESVRTTGSVIGEVIGDINVISRTWTESFSVNAVGEEVPQEVEQEPGVKHILLTEVVDVGTFGSAMALTDTVRGESLELETEA
jgi:hypothetical protein